MNEFWKYLEENNLTLNLLHAPAHLKCCLCNSVMRQATYTKCACSFCESCIHGYVSDGPRLCPECDKNSDNTTELIHVDDICVDIKANKLISKLRAHCPYEGCQKKMELKALGEHIRRCRMARHICVFRDMGCDSEDMCGNSELAAHMDRESMRHWKLLLDVVGRLQRGLCEAEAHAAATDNIGNDLANLTVDLASLSCAVRDSAAASSTMAVEMLRLRTMRETDQTRMDTIEKELERLKNASMPDVQSTNRHLKFSKVMKSVKEKVNRRGPTMAEKIQHDNMLVTSEVVSADRHEWSVMQLRQIPNAEWWSESFQIRRYSMRVGLFWCRDNSIGTYLFLQRSSSDDELPWPMPHTLEFRVSEPGSLGHIIERRQLCHRLSKESSNYDQPGQDRVCIADSYIYVSLDGLSSVLTSDSVLVTVEIVPASSLDSARSVPGSLALI